MIVLLVDPSGRPKLQDGVHPNQPFRVPVIRPMDMTWHPFSDPLQKAALETIDYVDCRCIDPRGRSVWTVGGERPAPHIGDSLGLLKRTQPCRAFVLVSELAILQGLDAEELAWRVAEPSLRALTGTDSLLRLGVRQVGVEAQPKCHRYQVDAEGLLPYIVRPQDARQENRCDR